MTDFERTTVAYGDSLMFVGKDRKTFIRVVRPGERLQTHYGFIDFDDLIGLEAGCRIKTHLGHDMWMLTPSTDDLLTHLKRETQIIFPKDLGYIMLKLNIQPGVRVIEAGTGSGSLTTALARMVGDTGHVYSYERRARMQQLAARNLARLGLSSRVSLIEQDIADGFDQQDVHAIFLDVPDPWEYLEQAHAAMRAGAFLGCIVPTINQVVDLVRALHSDLWFLVEAEELLLRKYRTLPVRIRPDDQMVGHTGYLIFARALGASPFDSEEVLPEENDSDDDNQVPG